MGRLLVASAVAAAFALGAAAPAHASFFENCKPAVSAKGKDKEDSMRSARKEAIEAWEKAAEKKYGEDYEYEQSGDRTFSCKWKTGKDIVCTVSARPCDL